MTIATQMSFKTSSQTKLWWTFEEIISKLQVPHRQHDIFSYSYFCPHLIQFFQLFTHCRLSARDESNHPVVFFSMSASFSSSRHNSDRKDPLLTNHLWQQNPKTSGLCIFLQAKWSRFFLCFGVSSGVHLAIRHGAFTFSLCLNAAANNSCCTSVISASSGIWWQPLIALSVDHIQAQ